MTLLSFSIGGFWYHIKYDPKHNIGYDRTGDIWIFRNGRLVHADNPNLFTKNFYSEPIKSVA